MTAIEERPQMLGEEFERLAEVAARDDIRLELIHGKLGVKAVPDGDHNEIIRWVMRQCLQQCPELWMYQEQGLCVEAYRTGRARPDALLAPDESFAGQGEWADPAPVLMAVEVTSYDSDSDARDRRDKVRAYAETGIPVYLLIDRDSCETLVYSEPSNGIYSTLVRRPFGDAVELPAPAGMVLDTERMKNWVR
ncbi:Uma2 family endonuclease [Kitasatospora sp. RB6PN24]|uniref:Uma2 family endonuclease n=1 Tax=Kitasatospora humi TaxID=2893891 RepID=UPI001E40AEA4|nr:Uma2 family endonuclease [Kitasatospora humi]MCC9307589.1 Uma2 family endonuclease [Kitasatospora humi]